MADDEGGPFRGWLARQPAPQTLQVDLDAGVKEPTGAGLEGQIGHFDRRDPLRE